MSTISYNKLLLHSITVISIKNERRQVNEKFLKLERGYRDCIKGQETRQGYTVYRMMHQALDNSDQTRKYSISESIIQALIMTLLQTMS